jgi:hypothetical protein
MKLVPLVLGDMADMLMVLILICRVSDMVFNAFNGIGEVNGLDQHMIFAVE